MRLNFIWASTSKRPSSLSTILLVVALSTDAVHGNCNTELENIGAVYANDNAYDWHFRAWSEGSCMGDLIVDRREPTLGDFFSMDTCVNKDENGNPFEKGARSFVIASFGFWGLSETFVVTPLPSRDCSRPDPNKYCKGAKKSMPSNNLLFCRSISTRQGFSGWKVCNVANVGKPSVFV
jgi:hypothetical protein